MPSLYESTVNTGEVSSSNFTTLYNASGLSVPNAGAGSVTGNLNVGGNLTVQGNSLLIGDVTLQSTLSLPNYTFPLPDGTTDQVLVTDGNGNLYWTDVSAIPGADYNISATTATGGANLTLANTAGFTDNVKFASGTNITVTRTDANTITISTVADNIPDGTAQGQVLYWNGSAWTADNVITSLAAADRFIPEFKNIDTSRTSSAIFRRNYASTAYTTGLASTIAFQFDSDSQALVTQGSVGVIYDTTNPSIIGATSLDNFTTSVKVFDINSTNVNFNGTNLVLNANGTGAAAVDATITVERGTTGADATLAWNETTDTWNFNNSLTVAGTYSQTGESIAINSDSTAADSFLYMKGSTEYLKWDNTNSRFELSDQLYITQTDIPAILERRNLSTAISPSEQKSSIRLINRVTDAANNDTVTTGPGITFARTSGATDATERLFASMGSSWNGTDKTAQLAFTWSNDNFSEPTPGVFPGSYSLLILDTDYSRFYNDSVYIDYSTPGNQKTATSITGGNTLVFGTAHGFSIGERIKYMSTTQNGLTQFTFYYVLSAGFTTTQCQLSLTTTGTAVALTNGTGLTLNFAELINQVGINTSTPGYTLDVNGTLNSVGNVTVQSDEITINADKTNTNVNLNFGRAAPDNNALIRWNSTSDSFEWSSGDGVFHDFIDATLTAPFTNGQLLSYLNGEWINDNKVTTTDAGERNVFSYRPLSPQAGPNSALFLRKDYSNAAPGTSGVGTYANGAGTALTFSVSSDTQNSGVANNYATLSAVYDSANPYYQFRTSIDAGTTLSTIGQISGTAIDFAGSTLTLNSENTGAATNATITTNRGSSGADVSIRWNESTNRWQDTTDGTTYLNIPNQNLDTTDSVSFSDVTVDGITTYNSQTTTTTSTATVQVAGTAKISLKAMIKVTDNVTGEMQMLEALAFRKGTTAYLTTYAEMYSNAALASFSVTGTGGLTSINATPLSTNSTTFTVARISLD